MTSKYILTGPPGSGKSSILLELEARGEYIIREAAEDVIKRCQSKGIEKPWELPDFQRDILKLQLQREERIPKNLERVFIDRGILDGLAYIKPGTDTYKEIQKQAIAYAGVFFIELLGEVQKTKVRREDDIAAYELGEKLKEIYLMAGYKIPIIQPNSVDERANLILRLVNSDRSFK